MTRVLHVAPSGLRVVDYALAYAQLGWCVFPAWGVTSEGHCRCSKGPDCQSPGKHPCVKGWKDVATTEPEQIRTLWKRFPDANIALYVGAAGLAVIDVDPRNGGTETLAQLEATYGILDRSLVQLSGGGGEHIFLHDRPNEFGLPSSLGPGVDVKHGPSYLIVAPSSHKSGDKYAFAPGLGPWDDEFALMMPVPDWMFGFRSGARGGNCSDCIDKPATKEIDEFDALSPDDEETEQNVARVASALEWIPADLPRQEWRNILYSLHSTGWAGAEKIAREWSQSARRLYNKDSFNGIWESATKDKPGRITITTLFSTAKEYGWERLSSKPDTAGDISNGRRFAICFLGKLLYDHQSNQWYKWDGNRWAPDQQREVMLAAKEMADALVTEEAQAFTKDPSDTNKRRHGHALSLHRNETRLRAMLSMAASEPGMSIPNRAHMDTNPFLLGVRNGIIDLRSGKLLPADPSQRISRLAEASYCPKATCDGWRQFLLDIMCGDRESVAFLQRALGYTLTGVVDEECFFFLQGEGANGKSTFANIIMSVLGDYAVTVGSKLLLQAKHDNEAERLKMRLPGARLALANETGLADMLDDQRVKELVSRERIAARPLYGEAIEFVPTHKLWVRGNHRPGVRDAGDAMWRRIVLIPFEHVFESSGRIKDFDRQVVERERDGILHWLLQGCLEWLGVGLKVPRRLNLATAGYRADTDIFAEWLETYCEVRTSARAETGGAYAQYQRFCAESGMACPSRVAFARMMVHRGFPKKRSNGRSFFVGLTLKNEDDEL